jgi:KUP system potassium uptake protein
LSSLAGDAEQVRPQNIQRFRPVLILTALGIVYGDIGTSPLYVFQAIAQSQNGRLDEQAALGSLSLIVWTLIVIVTIKYSLVVMRADNHGEGGILALMSLTRVSWRGRNRYLIACGLIGAALLYGDGMITPAISVLSAVEGLKVASHAFAPYTMPIAAVVLLLLFVVQRLGTAVVGRAFGPLMLLWFVCSAVLGIMGILRAPRVLAAIDPRYAVEFLGHSGITSLAILGGVFLCVTGAEAMYADMGHLGRAPIRIAWTGIVLPALLLNYAGQTAIALQNPAVGEGLFFQLAPSWMLYPLVALATVATIIASQAIITGSFSLTRQAMQLGWLPGIQIDQTSAEQYGQIYVPFVNWLTMCGTILLTVVFARSDRLAGAYGAAVSTTMLMTTAILYRVMRVIWRWRPALARVVFSFFLAVDIAFFIANLTKIADGGWIPLVIGGAIFTVMTTWHAGMDAMHRTYDRDAESVAQFLRKLHDHKIERSPGQAIYLTRLREFIPPLIAGHVRQMASLPEEAIALTVHFAARPRMRPGTHVRGEKLGNGFWHLNVRFGFMEVPDVPRVLHQEKAHCPADLDNATYFSERDHVTGRTRKPRMAAWRRRLFAFLYRNSIHPADRFNLPAQNFVQISGQIEV